MNSASPISALKAKSLQEKKRADKRVASSGDMSASGLRSEDFECANAHYLYKCPIILVSIRGLK